MINLLLVLIFLGAFLHLHRKRRARLRPTRPCPPGPKGFPIIGNLFQHSTEAPHIHLWQLAKKHGPVMSLKLGSIPVVIVSSPKAVEEALKKNDLIFSNRPKLVGQYKLFYDGLDVAFSRYGELWRELRKLCIVHLLSNRRVQSFRNVREEQVFKMMEKLSLSADSGKTVNLNEVMVSLTSALICRIAFGKIGVDGGSEFKRFDKLMVESQAMQAGFFFADYLPWLGWVDRVTGKIRRLNKIFKDFDEFLDELIEDHLNPDRIRSSNPNILEILIELKHEKSSPIELTWNHIKGILMDIFVAGTDTAAVTVVWAMTALMKTPEVMKKLQKDVRDIAGEKGYVNEDDIPKLLYLKVVIKETLRLYPPTPLLLPRETLDECTIQGYAIRPKTMVHINAWSVARDPEYWDRPDEFIPERFFDTSVDVMGQDYQVLPFGSGRRGCPGIVMGLANVEIVLANLVCSFDWELPVGVSKEDIDTDVAPGLTMHKKNPLRLVPKPRKFD
ncbi:cytochrome P450 83B1-like [Andrographis paniculata]|uniref:cytochrome P450 83B1-like n=1 Tax=Andrographis paniculata TaxID=175694 RepID=UPI0021E96F73|nr:cytochrome P450 83B1-like [Andrographis paniculata]